MTSYLHYLSSIRHASVICNKSVEHPAHAIWWKIGKIFTSLTDLVHSCLELQCRCARYFRRDRTWHGILWRTSSCYWPEHLPLLLLFAPDHYFFVLCVSLSLNFCGVLWQEHLLLWFASFIRTWPLFVCLLFLELALHLNFTPLLSVRYWIIYQNRHYSCSFCFPHHTHSFPCYFRVEKVSTIISYVTLNSQKRAIAVFYCPAIIRPPLRKG